MPNSILDDTKAALGLLPDYTVYDAELIMHINGVISELNQLGIGADVGYEIVTKDDTWDELLGTEIRYDLVKPYIYLKVKMIFDPPTTGYVLTSMEKLLDRYEWRINNAREQIVHPLPVEVAEETFEDVILDGGAP